MEEKFTNEVIGRFLISFNTDNFKENKDIAVILLGKHILKTFENGKTEKEFRIYKLKVNSGVRDTLYFNLLLEDDFSNTDFKVCKLQDLKNYILNNKSMLRNNLFDNDCGVLRKFMREVII